MPFLQNPCYISLVSATAFDCNRSIRHHSLHVDLLSQQTSPSTRQPARRHFIPRSLSPAPKRHSSIQRNCQLNCKFYHQLKPVNIKCRRKRIKKPRLPPKQTSKRMRRPDPRYHKICQSRIHILLTRSMKRHHALCNLESLTLCISFL